MAGVVLIIFLMVIADQKTPSKPDKIIATKDSQQLQIENSMPLQSHSDNKWLPGLLPSETRSAAAIQSMEKRDIHESLKMLMSAWHSNDRKLLILSERDFADKLQHCSEQDLNLVITTLITADYELKYRLAGLLAEVASRDTISALINATRSDSLGTRMASLDAISNRLVALTPQTTEILIMALDQAIISNDSGLVLALGQPLANTTSRSTLEHLIKLVDNPAIDETITASLMQAIGSTKSSDLANYLGHYLENDPNLSTNAAIAVGDAIISVQDSSSADILIRWAQKADFDKVGDQAKYWFQQLARDNKIKYELQSVKQLYHFSDQRMIDLVYEVGFEHSR